MQWLMWIGDLKVNAWITCLETSMFSIEENFNEIPSFYIFLQALIPQLTVFIVLCD